MTTFIRCAAFLLAALPLAATAQTLPPPPPPESTLTVTGEGLISKSPDEAELSAQIVTNDNSATTSSSKNNDVYNALKSRLAGLPIAGDSLRTTAYNVEFIPYPPKGLPPEQREPRYGHVTTRSVSITVSPIELVGKVIDAATAAGVTNVGDVAFRLKDRRTAYMAALSAATADARRQAAALAAAASVRIDHVRAITTGYDVAPYRPVMPMAKMAMSVAEAPTPTQIDAAGPIDVSARVTITFVIH